MAGINLTPHSDLFETVQVKEEVNVIESLCYGCLSSDRRLTVLSENTDLFVYLLGRNVQLECIHIPLCWECSAILRNTRRFQQRIRRAQELMQLQQTLYQQLTLQTLKSIDRSSNKAHSSLCTKIFKPDHYDLCIQHTDTQKDIHVNVEIKIEIEECGREESLNDEVQHSQEDLVIPPASTRNDTITNSSTDTIERKNNNQVSAFKKQLIVLLERIDEKSNVQVKYENVYDSDIDIDEVDIEAGLTEQEECSAQDTNIEHQLYKHDVNLIEIGIDSDDCESNVSDGRFSERGMESVFDAEYRRNKLSDDYGKKTEVKIEATNAKHVVKSPSNTLISVKRFSCEICDKGFKDMCKLQTHLRTHTGEKPYRCEICDKRFANPDYLKRHMAIHQCDKPYSCELCDKQFSFINNLKRHLIVHTGEKPFCCGVCDKSFGYRNDLKSHQRIHTGEKPYHCEICDKRFAHSGTMSKHVRVHTGEKPFGCKTCGKKFSDRSTLRQHCQIFNHLRS